MMTRINYAAIAPRLSLPKPWSVYPEYQQCWSASDLEMPDVCVISKTYLQKRRVLSERLLVCPWQVYIADESWTEESFQQVVANAEQRSSGLSIPAAITERTRFSAILERIPGQRPKEHFLRLVTGWLEYLTGVRSSPALSFVDFLREDDLEERDDRGNKKLVSNNFNKVRRIVGKAAIESLGASKWVFRLVDEQGTRRTTRVRTRPPPQWSSPLTRDHCATWLKNLLLEAGESSTLCMDEGAMLYVEPALRLPEQIPLSVAIPFGSETSYPRMLDSPTRETARDLVFSRIRSPQVREYLDRHGVPEATRYETKVGLVAVERPIPHLGTPLRLVVEPLSYLVVESFNRAIVRDRCLQPPNGVGTRSREARRAEELNAIYHGLLRDTIRPSENAAKVPGPSALYVQFVLLTSDQKYVIVEKNTSHSVLARASRKWSATLEHGLAWQDICEGSSLNLSRIVSDALSKELGIREIDFTYRFFGVGLECTHLNSGVLGEVSLDLSSTEVRSCVSKSEYFAKEVRFLSVEQATVWAISAPTMQVHPTGRLRLALSLASRERIHLFGSRPWQ
jgi:hypothetical protein